MVRYDYSDRDPLTAKIIAACCEVHNKLGPGFVERIYFNALKVALKKLGLAYQEEMSLKFCSIMKKLVSSELILLLKIK